MLLDCESNRRLLRLCLTPRRAELQASSRGSLDSNLRPTAIDGRLGCALLAIFAGTKTHTRESQAPRSCIHVYKDSEPYILHKTRLQINRRRQGSAPSPPYMPTPRRGARPF